MNSILHRAPWVATGSNNTHIPAVLSDGGVLVNGDRIVEIDAARRLGKYATHTIDHSGCILTPALVNAHTHLELSWMTGDNNCPPPAEGAMTEWIGNLLAVREAKETSVNVEVAARIALASQLDCGVGLVADIGNRQTSEAIGEKSSTEVLFFLELLGLGKTEQQEALARSNSIENSCTPHAPYSTGPELLIGLKKRATAKNQPFSLHVAESAEEITFLQNGTGPFQRFLKARGALDDSFDPPHLGPIQYLEKLGVLDELSLCVHCVHLRKEDIAILAAKKTKVCICPGSNRYIGVGTAPVPAMLSQGLLPGLGTDSLASNQVLSVWEEMRLLRQDWPEIDPATVFSMATEGGARALLREKEFGMLGPGKKAALLSITANVHSAGEVLEFLTSSGTSIQPNWVKPSL